MVTLTLFYLIVRGIKTADFGEKTLKIIDNFPPGAFYSHPHTLWQLGTKEWKILAIKGLGFWWIY